MRWFGVSPATADELADRRDARHMIRDTVPTGMFGHAQLHCDDDASTAERFSTDAAYVPNASWRTHFHIGFEAVKKLLTLRNGDAQSV